jgi:hypothetical protein
MTIPVELLRGAVHMLTGDLMTLGEASALSTVLGSADEVLPYLVLKRGEAFRQPALAGALADTASRLKGHKSVRSPDLDSALRIRRAQDAAAVAMEAVIKQELAGREAHRKLDDALVSLAKEAQGAPWPARLHIRD